MNDWKDLQYLKKGNLCQQHAYVLLEELALWPTLYGFDPVLAGTIPLAIDVPTSDIDIICEVTLPRQAFFEQLLQDHYGNLSGFQLGPTSSRGHEAIVGSFHYAGVVIEVFGQALPTTQQYAYRHLVVEQAILQAGSEAWRRTVQHLKQQGLKTEPAFAFLLDLPGDPYESLLALEGKSSSELAVQLAQCPLLSIGNEVH
ncbi:DUF4269 domain-containing protein [Hymenobacter sp. B1770]|uniref:DUF4269 domain-containing protein n=1 Tax=Hymenobacter sp. B1770 TaxID=1718788 RepID=UPI003CF4CED8